MGGGGHTLMLLLRTRGDSPLRTGTSQATRALCHTSGTCEFVCTGVGGGGGRAHDSGPPPSQRGEVLDGDGPHCQLPRAHRRQHSASGACARAAPVAAARRPNARAVCHRTPCPWWWRSAWGTSTTADGVPASVCTLLTSVCASVRACACVWVVCNLVVLFYNSHAANSHPITFTQSSRADRTRAHT